MNRASFLSRVSSSVMSAVLPDEPPIANAPAGDPPSDLLGLFRSRAQAANAVVHGPVSRHSVPRAVGAIAAGHSISSFVAWDDLPAPGVSSGLVADGYRRANEDDDGELKLADAELGITGAMFGLAESGSVVLSHGPGRGRSVSLLPPIHIALLEVGDIRWTLSNWAHENPALVQSTANLVIVTGPSRTGDIELQLNLGVHGPKHVHVVLIK